MTEKRKDPRYKVRILVRYKALGQGLSEWQDNPRVENISLGGMLFDAYEKFPVSAILLFKLQIFINDDITRIVEVRAKVVDVRESFITYPTRVTFIDLDQEAKALLSKFIDYLR